MLLLLDSPATLPISTCVLTGRVAGLSRVWTPAGAWGMLSTTSAATAGACGAPSRSKAHRVKSWSMATLSCQATSCLFSGKLGGRPLSGGHVGRCGCRAPGGSAHALLCRCTLPGHHHQGGRGPGWLSCQTLPTGPFPGVLPLLHAALWSNFASCKNTARCPLPRCPWRQRRWWHCCVVKAMP
jgi:hypothetical protein